LIWKKEKCAMATKSSKLLRALKARFPRGPRQVLRKLGLDEDLLEVPESDSRGEHDSAMQLRLELEKAIDEEMSHYGGLTEKCYGKLLDILDRHAPHGGGDRRKATPDEIEPMTETMPAQNMGAADDEHDDGLEPFRDRLRDHGLSEDEVEHATRLARDHLRRKRANGRDRLPIPAAHGGFGGHLSGRSKDANLRKARDRMAKIESEPSDDRRLSMDERPALAPSRQQRAAFHARFPGSEKLLDLAGTGL
jgi:hypothetical protein